MSAEITPLVAARKYIACGWAPIPIPFRQKRCLVEGWPSLSLTDETATRYFNGERQNIGVLLGDASGGLVDIDLDCPEAIALADNFLPPTKCIFGRPTAPRSHRIYVSAQAETAKFVEPPKAPGAKPSMLVELRSTGAQTVFPPSTHELGEPIEFESDAPPLVVGHGELHLATMRLAVACLLVRNGWVRANAIAAAQGNPILLDKALHDATALANKTIGDVVASWTGLEVAEVRAQRRSDVSVGDAVERYNREHAREWPRSGGECPLCGHADCFGRLPKAPERWACFSASHTEGGLSGRVCWHGDALDVDAHESGCGRVELLKRRGYLPDGQRPPNIAPGPAPAAVATLNKPRNVLMSEKELTENWLLDEGPAFIPSGIPSLDLAIGGGLPVRQVTVVLGGTGVGKSDFARQIRNKVAAAGSMVVHVDVELRGKVIAMRNISQEAEIASSLLKRPRGEWNDQQIVEVATVAKKRAALPIWTLCPGGSLPLEELGAIISVKLSEITDGKPSLVILDSAQRLAAAVPNDNPRLQIQEFMRWLEVLARSVNAAFLLTSETKRTQDNVRPTAAQILASGAESRAIEYTADVVIALIPASSDDDDSAGESSASWERRVSVNVAKARDGRIGYLADDVLFTGPTWGMRCGEHLDEFSESLLEYLDDNGRTSVRVLSKKLGRRRPFVQAKLKALEEAHKVSFINTGNNATMGWELVPEGPAKGVVPGGRSNPNNSPWKN